MLIRSQDKKILFSIERFALGITLDHKIIAERDLYMKPSHSLNSIIGEYSTEEKAIKVLDWIAEAFDDGCYSIFQMPQDDEVRV